MENLETKQNLLAENEETIGSIDSNLVNLWNVMWVIDSNNSNESIDSWEPIKWYCDIEELRALLEQWTPEQKKEMKEKLINYLNNSDSKNAQRVRMSKNAIIYLSDDGKIIINEEEEWFTKWEKGLILSWEWKNWSVDAWRTK